MTSISIERILSRAKDLDFLEQSLRRGREQTGEMRWPFGDLIQATLDDVRALVAELEQRRDEPSIVKAIVGLLRAEGYQVTEPGAIGDDDGTIFGNQNDAPVEHARPEVAEQDAGHNLCPNCKQPMPAEGVCSRYLDCPKESRKNPLDDGASEAMGPICPKCKGALVVPGGPCTYPECASSEAATVELKADLPGAMPFPTSAAPPARQRAEEPKIMAADWNPDGKDMAGIAEVLGRNVETIATLVAEFKDAMSSAPPQSRWRPAFCSWVRKNRPVAT